MVSITFHERQLHIWFDDFMLHLIRQTNQLPVYFEVLR